LVKEKGKEALTESYCRDWLTRERRRKNPTPPPKPSGAPSEEPNKGEVLVPGSPEAKAAWEEARKLLPFKTGAQEAA